MSSRIPLVLALSVAVGLGGLVADQRGLIAPIRDTVLAVLAPFQSVVSLARIPGLEPSQSGADLRAENEQLRLTVERLNAEIVRLREVELESRRVLDEREYRRAHPELQFLAARVIGYDPTSVVRSVEIDKGSSGGVREGMVVVNSAGLVGKVMQVGSSWAKVLLIVDAGSSVNGMIQRSESRAAGVVVGQGNDQLLMRYLPQDEKVAAGDVIITSGLGGGFPKGLFVGYVTVVKRNDVDLFQEARLAPAVRFAKLETVLVVSNFLPVKLD